MAWILVERSRAWPRLGRLQFQIRAQRQQGQPTLTQEEIRQLYHIETYQDTMWYEGEEQCGDNTQETTEAGSGRTEDVNTDTDTEATEAPEDESVAAT